ncbi:MAG: thioredoxin [Solirubrobacterales bacterium]|nr:thioredoxin [Solirubrobacterales bacterium]
MTVIETTEADFQRDVIDASHQHPVVVDFWAPWCGPCRQLTPLLEKLADATDGSVVLAKVNTDEHPAVSQSYGVQGIPAVKAFVDGKIVDEFVGAQPPAQVQRFFAKLLPSEADRLAAGGDEVSLRAAIEAEPGHPVASLALARLLLARGEDAAALEVLGKVRGSFQADGLAARIRIGADPELDLGAALDALDDSRQEEALALLIDRVQRFPAQRDELRAIVVGVLDELGVEHPVARDARRRLAAALY